VIKSLFPGVAAHNFIFADISIDFHPKKVIEFTITAAVGEL